MSGTLITRALPKSQQSPNHHNQLDHFHAIIAAIPIFGGWNFSE